MGEKIRHAIKLAKGRSEATRENRDVIISKFYRLDANVTVVHITNQKEMKSMTDELSKETDFFDTESVPASQNLALIQIATATKVFLVYSLLPRLQNTARAWSELTDRVFNNMNILKVGKCTLRTQRGSHCLYSCFGIYSPAVSRFVLKIPFNSSETNRAPHYD